MNKIIATANDDGRTIFKLISKYFNNIPISRIEKIFRKNDIKINNIRKISKNHIVKKGDEIIIYGLDENLTNTIKKEVNAIVDFHVIYEDDNIILINKKTGVPVHTEENNLDDKVIKYLNYKQVDSFMPSHIGRLDKVTSGIIVYAKNYKTLIQMKEKQHNFEKIYQFRSDLPEQEMEVKFYLQKDEEKQKMKVVERGKELAITRFFFENGKKYAQLITGKKHQIRVSLAKLNYPIYGDRKYGGKKAERVFLHSYRIKFQNLEGHLKYLNEKEFISYPKW